MITVGVANGRVAYVSSTAAGSQAAPAAATLTATQAWLPPPPTPASRRPPPTSAPSPSATAGRVRRQGPRHAGRAGHQAPDRPARAAGRLPDLTQGVRPAFETIVLDVDGGKTRAYRSFVDARSGEVLSRANAVQQAADARERQRHLQRQHRRRRRTAAASPPRSRSSRRLLGRRLRDRERALRRHRPQAASARRQGRRLVRHRHQPGGGHLLQRRRRRSPTAPTRSSSAPFDDPTVPASGETFDYTGGYAVNDTAATPSAATGNPSWKFFEAAPLGVERQPQGRLLPERDGLRPRALQNRAARGPWDAIPATGTPSFTTQGNAARTAEARTSPLTPGPFGFMPISVNRKYQFPWANQWATSKCDPTQLAARLGQRHLRLGHEPVRRPQPDARLLLLPRLHRGELQPAAVDNFGAHRRPDRRRTTRRSATSRPAPSPAAPDLPGPRQRQPDRAAGRHPRHHQPVPLPADRRRVLLALHRRRPRHSVCRPRVHPRDHQPDGRRPRRRASPAEQGGAMGESWGDLVALEYLYEHGYSTGGENPWAEGPYATGNKKTRHPRLRAQRQPAELLRLRLRRHRRRGPRRRRDLERHASGRSARRWCRSTTRRSRRPTRRCSCAAPTAAGHDRADAAAATSARATAAGSSWCSTPSCSSRATTSMLDARDAMLAADRMRFGGANQAALWNAFAKRGMGESASTDTDRGRPAEAGLRLAAGPERDGHVRHRDAGRRAGEDLRRPLRGARHPGRGHRSGDGARRTAKLVPGTYDVLVRAPGLRPAAVHAHGRGGPDADADLRADAERGVEEPGRDGDRRRHRTSTT